MHRPTARQHGDDVEADGQAAIVRLPAEPKIGGVLDASLGVGPDGLHCRLKRRPGLYLDDGDEIAPPRDEVDLAKPGAMAHCKDAIALQAKGPGRQPFAAMALGEACTALLSDGRFQDGLSLRSSAR